MSRSIARIASVLAVATVAALTTTAALADNSNGNGNSASAPGQVKKAQPAQPQAATPVAQSSTAPGIKPSNTTDHSTKCTTGGGTGTTATCKSSNANTTNADASKRYGNGKTAAQIANGNGAPAGTTLTGPGNSQPHKVAVCPGKTNKSGGKDVHAVKSYPTCPSSQTTSSAAVNSASTSSSSSSSSSTFAAQSTQSTAVQSTQSTAVVSENAASTMSAQGSVQSVGSRPLAATRMSRPSAEGGVLGAVKALSSPSTSSGASHANAGVLGKLSPLRVLGGTLPFSGFPLWAALLVALGLLGFGLFVRHRAAAAH